MVSNPAREAIATADELLVSVVSFVEIGIKAATGKLHVPPALREHLIDAGVRVLGLDVEHGLALASLPMHHRDPFDRLLVVQARAERLTIVSADRRLAAYDVPIIDAG
jgi:PIN domain nuclease of toxin-antitoxin system